MAGAADGALDETDAVMRAGGIDAFAAPVGDFAKAACDAARKAGKPAPEISPSVSERDPARDQPQRHAALARRQRGALGRFLEIQQAEIIFPSLAHHRFLGALDRIGIEMRDLLHDLALQIAGVGGDPEARPVLLRPEAGGREIAQRLAGAGARFHQRDCAARRPPRAARRHRSRRRYRLPVRGAACPPAARSRARASSGVDRLRARRAHRRFVFPLRQAAPGFQAGDGRAVRHFAQRAFQQRRPAPARARQSAGQRRKTRRRLRGKVARFVQQAQRRQRSSARDDASGVCGNSRPSARARPSALGTKGWPGRTKANSSSTSNSGLAAGAFSRPADKSGMRHQHMAGLENLARLLQREAAAMARAVTGRRARRRRHQRGQAGKRIGLREASGLL